MIEKHEIVALGDNLSQRLLDDRYSPSKLFRISVGRAWTKLLTAGEILSLKNFMRQRTDRATTQDREHGLPAGQILWREAPPRVAEILPGGNATVEDAPCNSTDVPPNPSPATTSKAHVRRHGTGRGPRCWPAAGDLTMFGSHSGIVRRPAPHGPGLTFLPPTPGLGTRSPSPPYPRTIARLRAGSASPVQNDIRPTRSLCVAES